MATHYQEPDPIVVGSGELYVAKFSDITNPANLTEEDEAKLINIGAISEDAVINIKKEYKDATSANRGVVYKFNTTTAVTFKAGVMTFILENLSKILYGSSYTEDTSLKTKKMIVGHGDATPQCYLRFVHTDKRIGKKLIVNIFKAMFVGEQEFAALSTQINGNPAYVEFIEDESEVA